MLRNSSSTLITFSWYDYTLFGFMLGLSALIGIYFGCFGKKQSTASEYLLGGKTMKVFPIAMSLISSHISGVLLLAVPADIYLYGTTYTLTMINVVFIGFLNCYVYMPVFHKMQVTSVFEYLKARFNTKIRMLSSLLFTLSSCLYLPIVIYIPALAFSQATGVDVHLVAPLVCSVCIFYTTIGGLKAVVWTDALQFTAMLGGVLAVIYVGIKAVGGITPIWEKGKAGGRFEWDTDISPFKRDTIWSVSIGLTVNWINSVCINQGTVQKFLSLPTVKDINMTLVFFLIGESLMKLSSFTIGLIMFAHYYDCDPFTSGKVKRHDELLPYFIMDVAGSIPGLPGLFIAGIFCAALSTLSAVMNSLAGTIYEDFVSQFMPENIKQKTVSNILKMIVVTIGIVATSMVFVVEQLGGLLPLVFSFNGVTAGALLGIFSLGMLVPTANSKGALCGAVASLLFMSWLVVGTQWYRTRGYLQYEKKSLRTDGCYNFTNTKNNSSYSISVSDDFEPMALFKVSIYYYTLMGTFVVFLVGVPVSWLTNKNDAPVNRDLISPVCHWLLPKVTRKSYYSVEAALKMMDYNSQNPKR